MKDSTVILLVVGGFVLLFWAFSKGIITAGVGPTGLGVNPATGKPYGVITAPQPSTNYSGYLAATTAPGVSGALNGALSGIGSGLNNLFSGWFGGQSSNPTPSASNQIASANSPALNAQPAGPVAAPFDFASTFQGTSNPVGPVVNPDVSYNATNWSAFDYNGLAASNSPDMTYSLMDPNLADGSGVYG